MLAKRVLQAENKAQQKRITELEGQLTSLLLSKRALQTDVDGLQAQLDLLQAGSRPPDMKEEVDEEEEARRAREVLLSEQEVELGVLRLRVGELEELLRSSCEEVCCIRRERDGIYIYIFIYLYIYDNIYVCVYTNTHTHTHSHTLIQTADNERRTRDRRTKG